MLAGEPRLKRYERRKVGRCVCAGSPPRDIRNPKGVLLRASREVRALVVSRECSGCAVFLSAGGFFLGPSTDDGIGALDNLSDGFGCCCLSLSRLVGLGREEACRVVSFAW